MVEFAQQTLEIISDYRNDDGIQISVEDIITWAQQFDNDAEFILTELNHILSQVYLSKPDAKRYIKLHMDRLIEDYGYPSVSEFLMDTYFLDVQPNYKSQSAILELVEEILNDEYNESYKSYLTFPKRNFIYFDDVLASGGTIGSDMITWLNQSHNDDNVANHFNVKNNNFRVSIHFFCIHNWGLEFQKFRINKTFETNFEKKITWHRNYTIENHVKWNNQALNNVIPILNQPPNARTYLANLAAEKYEEYSTREENLPSNEKLFSNAENRLRYENIMLQKGLEIISMIQGNVSSNIRPLGLINPNYKTYGLGTQFFTWRNIPNNCPLVFWWDVPSHDWHPLFPVANRGK